MQAFQTIRSHSVVAIAASLGIVSASLIGATPAYADDQGWACKVMLCASNPGGWMEFAECVPPIEKLLTHLATGGSFPVCVSGGMSSAKYTRSRYGVSSVVFTMQDGSRIRYAVPTQAQVDAAAQTGTLPQQ